MGILFTQFHCVTNLCELLSQTRLCRMRVFRLQNLFSCNYNGLNLFIVLCHAVKLSQLRYSYENSNMVESDKNCDVSCKNRMVCLFDDDDFDEKKGIKPHLQPLYLQSELIILSFLFKRMLSNKICFEFWARQQRL